MLPAELKEYVTFIQTIQSETEEIEVKAAHVDCPKKLYDTLSSFSNRSGAGIIIFGLDEAKGFEAVGVYDVNNLQKKVTEQCNLMVPKVRAIFTVLELQSDKFIVSAEIPEISKEEKPCYYSGVGINKGSYIRVGDADEPMSSYEVYNYNSYKTKTQDDLRYVERAELEDLDSEKLDKYLNKLKEQKPNLFKLDRIKVLQKLGIIKAIDDNFYPTVTGLLMFGLYPQAFFPQYVITAVVVPGYKMGETSELGERFLDNKKIEGTLPEMLDGAVSFIIKNMKWRTVIRDDNAKRDDRPEYPIKAIREALLNTLMHRDYSSYTEGSYIQIRMFNDRIEIQSPGGLYGGVTIENLGDNKNETRNRNLVRLLEDLQIVENRGSGIPTMIKEMRDLKLEPPVFEEKRGDFWVVFKNHTLMTREDIEWIKKLGVNLTEDEAIALTFIKNNEKITNGDYQKLNNINRDKALIDLKKLISKGLIESQGVGGGIYYILNKNIKDMDQSDSLDSIITENNDLPPKFTTEDKELPPKMIVYHRRWPPKIKKVIKLRKMKF
jgi:ATP-dependent DNA helicase RecG